MTTTVNASWTTENGDSGSEAGSGLTVPEYIVAIVSPVAIVLNGVVLITFARVGNILPKTTRLLMLHQAYIEIMYSSLTLALRLTSSYQIVFPSNDFGLVLCMTWDVVVWGYDSCLQLNCVLITLDRYFAVCHVMKQYLTKKRVIVLIVVAQVFCWSYNYASEVMMKQMDPSGVCLATGDPNILRPWGATYLVFSFAPIICVLTFYPLMIKAIVQSSKKMHSSSAPNTTKSAATKRLIRSGLVAAVALVISNAPDMILYSIIYACIGYDGNFGDSMQIVDFGFKIVYPVICPIIYSFSTEKFRSSVPIAFGCKGTK